MRVEISKQDILEASDAKIITAKQAEALWVRFSESNVKMAAFTGVNVAYYFGAFIIISAMTWFATEAFASFSSLGLMIISLLYFGGFLQAGKKLFENPLTRIPGGLLLTVAVFMVPLFIFSAQHYAGIWGTHAPGKYNNYFEWVKGGWFFMEIGTIATAVILIYRFRFPFLTFPIAFTLWYLSMDITPLLFGEDVSWKYREAVSILFGLMVLSIAYSIDRKTKEDYAFWLYLFGLLSFWGGLSLIGSGSELGKFIYFCINIGLIVISVLFRRKAFIVFGAIGSCFYIGHLSVKVFAGSLLFPIALTAIGMLVILLGIRYANNQKEIEVFVTSRLPRALLNLLPHNRT